MTTLMFWALLVTLFALTCAGTMFVSYVVHRRQRTLELRRRWRSPGDLVEMWHHVHNVTPCMPVTLIAISDAPDVPAPGWNGWTFIVDAGTGALAEPPLLPRDDNQLLLRACAQRRRSAA